MGSGTVSENIHSLVVGAQNLPCEPALLKFIRGREVTFYLTKSKKANLMNRSWGDEWLPDPTQKKLMPKPPKYNPNNLVPGQTPIERHDSTWPLKSFVILVHRKAMGVDWIYVFGSTTWTKKKNTIERWNRPKKRKKEREKKPNKTYIHTLYIIRRWSPIDMAMSPFSAIQTGSSACPSLSLKYKNYISQP